MWLRLGCVCFGHWKSACLIHDSAGTPSGNVSCADTPHPRPNLGLLKGLYFRLIHVYNVGMIGIFDSGYGGLTIMREIVKTLPQYDYLYLGDNARAPYGNHSKETVTKFSEEAVRFLFDKGCNLIIFACFTASSLALRELQEKYLRNPCLPAGEAKSKFKDRKILGVIRPIAEQAVRETMTGRIGVTGTRATVNSHTFDVELEKEWKLASGHKKGIKLDLTSQACPLLVPLIEEHWHTKPEARMILKKYLRPVKNHNVDTLILGCTHYPLMLRDFVSFMGSRVKVLNSGEIVARSLADYLTRHPEIEKKLSRGGARKFMTTDDPAKFKQFVEEFGGMKAGDVEGAEVGKITSR